jgi:hypothetical protein
VKFLYFSNKMGDVQFDQNMAMEDMWRALQENNNMHQAFERL